MATSGKEYTFESVWRTLNEVSEKQKELSEYQKQSAIESDKRKIEAEKSMAELKSHLKELQRNIGGMGEKDGDVAEEFIYNALEKDMAFGGIVFQDIQANVSKYSKALNLRGEFDIVLKNGDTIAIIETKQSVETKHITELKEKILHKYRQLFPEYNGYKIILGIGGLTFDRKAIQEANDNGIGLIKIASQKVEFQADNLKQY